MSYIENFMPSMKRLSFERGWACLLSKFKIAKNSFGGVNKEKFDVKQQEKNKNLKS